MHVPYKGGALALVDLVSGQLQYMFSAIPQVQAHVKSGRLRALALGHATRSRVAPDVPIIADTLPGFNNTSFYGVLAPARTPRDIVMRLNGVLNKTLTQADFVQRMVAQGVDAASSTPEGLTDIVRSETERWRGVIKRAGIVGEAIR
jgi:tripartite-type tricarboxylate transporter receptor subunit TctC